MLTHKNCALLLRFVHVDLFGVITAASVDHIFFVVYRRIRISSGYFVFAY